MKIHLDNVNNTGAFAGPTSSQTTSAHSFRTLVATGLIATVGAMAANAAVGAIALAAGVEFQVPDGGETIPLSGIAFVTGVFSVVGVVIAAALFRWGTQPDKRFLWVTLSLTTISLVPPWLVGASTATSFVLVCLHLVAAAVMIPTLTRTLHRPK